MISDFQKLVIVGAPRSGTNMLRDALCSIDSFGTWPCDEINAIWKHGHLARRFDDFPPESANERLRGFVRGRFDRMARTTGADVVVEKTCATSLRLSYVARLLPEARFVFLHRDGADATASAAKRWASKLDLAYTFAKARFVPAVDVPIYGWRFVRNRLSQMFDDRNRLAIWGPMNAAVADAARKGPVSMAAAAQWKECVTHTLDDLSLIENDRVHRLTYEEFVRAPELGLREILDFIGVGASATQISQAVGNVKASQVGRGRTALLKRPDIHEIAAVLNPGLNRLGYAPLAPEAQR